MSNDDNSMSRLECLDFAMSLQRGMLHHDQQSSQKAMLYLRIEFFRRLDLKLRGNHNSNKDFVLELLRRKSLELEDSLLENERLH